MPSKVLPLPEDTCKLPTPSLPDLEVWDVRASDMDTTMLWAAVTSGFIHFFPLRRDHSSVSSGIQLAVHPAYGDVAVDNV